MPTPFFVNESFEFIDNMFLHIYIYIYIYSERERDVGGANSLTILPST